MTEERIRDIIVENDVHLTDVIIKAMKQAVNEALNEASNEVLAVLSNGYTPNDDDILNLKVK